MNHDTSTYLMHHGVKGMRWGVRRYQNKDGSLTPEGKRRYGEDYEKASKELKSAKTAYRKFANKKNLDRLEDAKKSMSDAKIRSKIKGEKSEKTKALEAEYKKKYKLTDEEAEIQAYKNQRAKKIIAVSAGVAATAAIAYAAYKHYDNNVDKMLKADTLLQNINPGGMDFSKPFYASTNKLDNAKYRGLYGNQMLTQRSDVSKIIESKLKVGSEGIKIASRKSAMEALSDIVKTDKEFKSDLGTILKQRYSPMAVTPQQKALNRGYESFKAGKIDKHVYDAMNTLLVDRSEAGSNVSRTFYKTLRDRGYGAIKDMNDSKNSGYKSFNPLIVFGNQNMSKATLERSREVGRTEINKNLGIGYAHIMGSELAKTGAQWAAILGGMKAVSNVKSRRSELNYIRDYRTKHPNSDLTEQEILRLYRNED